MTRTDEQIAFVGAGGDGADRVPRTRRRWRAPSRLHRPRADHRETRGGVRGVHRHQTGDTEARLWLAADDSAALRAVAAIVRPRRRRASTSGNPAALARARARRGVMEPA